MNEISIDNKMVNKNTSGILLLPAEKLPECWNQEERMSALFSPFRSKSANPQDWTSKYKFWHNLIYEWLKYTMQCSFSIIDLNEAFKRRGCTPLCLVTVIEELLRNNEIIQETDFLQEPCETWTAWSIDIFIKKPINWSFSKVKNYVVGQNTNNTEVRYIHLRIVRELGDIILSIADIKKDNVLFPISEIVQYCKSKTKKQISENTVRLVLEWLRYRKKVAFRKNFNSSSELLVKITTETVNEITEVEEGTYKLMKQENELIKEIELMEQEKLNIINEAKSYLAKELRQMAKTCLRRKMELEKTIEKRAQALANLRTLITNIENAHSNSAVLSAYKTGSDVLKKIGQNGLMEYDVRDIMDDINEILEEKQEIDSILSETLILTDSDAELEKELAELLNKDNVDVSNVDVSESNPEIKKLEQRLKDLRMEEYLVEKGSSIPHLTKDVFKMITLEQQLLSVSLPSTILMADVIKVFSTSIADFVSMKEYINFLSIQDPAYTTNPGFQQLDSISIWPRTERVVFTADKYMELVQAYKPDLYVALCDGDTNINSSAKRVSKAILRSKT